MMFSCKYAERMLELLGNDSEEGSGIHELLEGLQAMESSLNS